jgi:hypothetical protein
LGRSIDRLDQEPVLSAEKRRDIALLEDHVFGPRVRLADLFPLTTKEQPRRARAQRYLRYRRHDLSLDDLVGCRRPARRSHYNHDEKATASHAILLSAG